MAFKVIYGEYIYLIQERESMRCNDNVFKIGRTAQEPNNRMKGYPNDSRLLLTVIVNDSVNAETDLIRTFKGKFKNRKDIGKEYFEGNPVEMMNIIIDYFKDNYVYTSPEGCIDPDQQTCDINELVEPIDELIDETVDEIIDETIDDQVDEFQTMNISDINDYEYEYEYEDDNANNKDINSNNNLPISIGRKDVIKMIKALNLFNECLKSDETTKTEVKSYSETTRKKNITEPKCECPKTCLEPTEYKLKNGVLDYISKDTIKPKNKPLRHEIPSHQAYLKAIASIIDPSYSGIIYMTRIGDNMFHIDNINIYKSSKLVMNIDTKDVPIKDGMSQEYIKLTSNGMTKFKKNCPLDQYPKHTKFAIGVKSFVIKTYMKCPYVEAKFFVTPEE